MGSNLAEFIFFFQASLNLKIISLHDIYMHNYGLHVFHVHTLLFFANFYHYFAIE